MLPLGEMIEDQLRTNNLRKQKMQIHTNQKVGTADPDLKL